MNLAIIHVLLGIVIILVEVRALIRHPQFNYRTFARVVLAVFFGFGAGILHYATAAGVQHEYSGCDFQGRQNYVLVLVACLVFWGTMETGWLLATRRRGGRADSGREDAGRRIARTIAAALEYRRFAVLASILCLAIGVGLYLLYADAYGGPVGLLIYSNAIRGGWAEVANPWSFLQRFGGLCIFASYLAYIGMLLSRGGRRALCAGLFALTVIASLYVLFSWAGRLTTGLYIVTFPLERLRRAIRPRDLGRVAGLFAVIVVAIWLGRDAFAIVRILSREDIDMSIYDTEPIDPLESAVLEIGFPTVSAATALYARSEYEFGNRWFRDVLAAPTYLVPKKFFPEPPPKLSTINGEFYGTGSWGEIPVDIVSFGLYNAGFLGVGIVGILYGLVLAYLDRIGRLFAATAGAAVFDVVIGLAAGNAIPYADPVNVLLGAFYLVLGFVILYGLVFAGRRWRRLRQLDPGRRTA